MVELKNYMKEGIQLSNKVKKQEALTLARMEVEKLWGEGRMEMHLGPDFLPVLPPTNGTGCMW
jgi:hypothetical protein